MIKPYRILIASLVLLLMLAACNASPPPEASGEEADVPAPASEGETAALAPSGQDAAVAESSALGERDSGEDAGESSGPEPDFPLVESFVAANGDPAAGGAEEDEPDGQTPAEDPGDEMIGVDLTIGAQTFAALFYDNEASRSLLGQMPFTIDMADLNRNEKYYHFPQALHAAATEAPSTIYAGEIMCWSGNSLVLFYDTFSNAYGGYVRVGYIEDTSGLAAAAGRGSVTITFRER